jgi:hypothetical protein
MFAELSLYPVRTDVAGQAVVPRSILLLLAVAAHLVPRRSELGYITTLRAQRPVRKTLSLEQRAQIC